MDITAVVYMHTDSFTLYQEPIYTYTVRRKNAPLVCHNSVNFVCIEIIIGTHIPQ